MRWSSSRLAAASAMLVALVGAALPRNAKAAAPGARFATSVKLVPAEQAGAARITVGFTSQPTYTARLEQKGQRLIVDVPNSDVKGVPSALTDRVGVVGGVMIQAFRTPAGTTSRILVTLLEAARYSIRVEENQLVIFLSPGKSGVVDAPRTSSPLPKPKAVAEPVRVADVRFEHNSAADRVLIELSETTTYRQLANARGKATLVVSAARLPKELSRTLDVSAFGGRVSSVSSFVDPRDKNSVVIEVEGDEKLTSEVTRSGRTLIWSFFEPGTLPSSMTGLGRDGGVARKTRTVHVEEALTGIPEVESSYASGAPEKPASGPADQPIEQAAAPEEAGAFTPTVVGQQRQRFTGRRIDLDLKDADIHNVLRLLADVGRVNIVTADNVQGSVTIRMRNVPWDQALDVVLQAKSLGMVHQGNMIRVAPLADLEKEREMAIARRQQEVKLAPLETRLIPVSYAQADDIQERAKPLLSERGSIAVDQRTNVMIVRDIAGNLNQIEELTRSLDTQTPQVLVEARIVEATSTYLRDVGIQWGGDTTFSGATGNPTGLAFPNSIGVVGGASDANTPTAGLSPFTNQVTNPNFAVNLPATVGTGSGGAIGLTFGSIDNTINLAVRLSAAESSGQLRILSSPRILTLDNRDARIAQGTLIPFSQISAQGVQTTFQEAKLQLLVRPHVTADGSVSMHVKINRDEPDFNQTSARGDPTILKREAETDLLVMDGHTAVIGGIFTRNTGRNLNQVPFFGDIPLIGLLFQRRRASDTRGELVIFLTPRIVNRAEALGR